MLCNDYFLVPKDYVPMCAMARSTAVLCAISPTDIVLYWNAVLPRLPSVMPSTLAYGFLKMYMGRRDGDNLIVTVSTHSTSTSDRKYLTKNVAI